MIITLEGAFVCGALLFILQGVMPVLMFGKRPSSGMVFATIRKAMPEGDEDIYPVLSVRHIIVLIADEAQRTRYGFEAKLKTRSSARKVPLAQAGRMQLAAYQQELHSGNGIVVFNNIARPEASLLIS